MGIYRVRLGTVICPDQNGYLTESGDTVALAGLVLGLFSNLNLHFLPGAERYPSASCGKRSSDNIPASEESVESGRLGRCPTVG